jgi:hypothetical protein
MYSIVNIERLEVDIDNELPVNDDAEKAVTTSLIITNNDSKYTTQSTDFIVRIYVSFLANGYKKWVRVTSRRKVLLLAFLTSQVVTHHSIDSFSLSVILLTSFFASAESVSQDLRE